MGVICNKATDSCLDWCIHSEEHEPEIDDDHGSCTKWGECCPEPDDQDIIIKVRCAKVKESTC